MLAVWMGSSSGCQQVKEDTYAEVDLINQAVIIEAENFLDESGEIIIDDILDGGKAVRSVSDAVWLSYEIEVPKDGRYSFELSLSSRGDAAANAWVEDYINNKDGRTYNITGSIHIQSSDTALKIYKKEGSPLQAGIHKIKVHLEGKDIQLDWFKFNLMREHRSTPKTLVQNTEGDEWKLVWSDEFNGEGLVDESNWTYDLGNWGWGNNELQYYTEKRLENARQQDGNLIIEAHRDDMGQPWTSARLTTRGKLCFLYGKVEFRAKVPVGDGSWAAGWFLGDDYRDEISWPYCGEIDVLETVGKEIDDQSGNGINHASCHTRAYYFKEGNHITNTIEVQNMDAEFHTYSIEWLPSGINAFIDGVPYYTYDKINSDLEWPFDRPQNIIVNLAMGGGFGGAVDPDLSSQKYILDYIRAYELK